MTTLMLVSHIWTSLGDESQVMIYSQRLEPVHTRHIHRIAPKGPGDCASGKYSTADSQKVPPHCAPRPSRSKNQAKPSEHDANHCVEKARKAATPNNAVQTRKCSAIIPAPSLPISGQA